MGKVGMGQICTMDEHAVLRGLLRGLWLLAVLRVGHRD